MGTLITGAVVALILGLAVYSVYKSRKNGNSCGGCSGCGSDCESCPNPQTSVNKY